MNDSNFVISTRNKEDRTEGTSRFGSEPGRTRYLEVPDGQTPHPDKHARTREKWLAGLRRRAGVSSSINNSKSPISDYTVGDILVFVHGYNNSVNDVMTRHNFLQRHLRSHGFSGAIVSFDWPSGEFALNYLEDRSDARATASRLVDDGIKILAFAQRDQDTDKCDIDVHLLGHSTGAYLIREAFYLSSQTRSIARINWNVSQIVFIGGDIARGSLSSRDCKSQALFHHSIRITNYQNPADSVLKLSNIKRLGLQPRVGRVGIPDDAPASVVNVNAGGYYRKKYLSPSRESTDSSSHSWHFSDVIFAEDLAHTLAGDVDRNVIPTRIRRAGELWLV